MFLNPDASPLQEFLLIYAAVYLATALLYFVTGAAIAWVNRRKPQRRIQARPRTQSRGKEIRQSLLSLTATSFCLAFGLFAQERTWTLNPLPLTPWSALGMFVLSVLIYDAWFYFVHRLQHTRWLYRWHALHHGSVTPTVWTNYHDSLVDAFGQQLYFLIAPFFLPIPPQVLIAHRLFDHFNGTFGHCGYEYFAGPMARWPSPLVCTSFHDQHHSRFHYNFANHFSIWDRLFGTLCPDYDRTVREMEQT